ncbi:ABC transporter permease [Pseudoclavibacter sp. RFBJ3]|uniref:ABC transporter permease n=1 Tax=unclassified Pseudoclavibacter TaxID=2615177 RepID=UPI000CE873DD|nr:MULTISPECIES: ABC transporter permease [unclassified Pseudoclavibacter]PPF36491.1 ABC transporter permease [Pseudoclavibacter sp. AY1H1]PPF74455.1 ABC transporter permease [Pseudoclavibacter sp. Z016]PPF82486.1 ABC transporter permease [Pseudoclavibacter sp. RFBJ5]PPF91379.1 ABC transporter permease [Pseudoclavibacter sp. RFBJ3]PPF96304.1 ABC transporter permease [Pseudoclavibacter sp. RFBH5]
MGLLLNLTLREIRSQYNRTALGRIWSLVNPLAQIAIFSVVFGLLFVAEPHVGTNSGLQNYALWVACGIIPWTFISGGIMGAMSALMANIGLLTKVYFPRHVLVTSSVLSLTTTFAIELLVLALLMGIAGGPKLLIVVLLLIPIVALTAMFVLGIGLMLSVAVVYFRDVQYLWTIFNQVWFYASGVVFPASLVQQAQDKLTTDGWNIFGQPVPLMAVFELNPAHQFLEAYRSVLYDFAVPSVGTWLTITAWAAIMLLAGIFVFRAKQNRIVEEL